LILALVAWLARDFIPNLATTRVAATASVNIPQGRSESDVRRAYDGAMKARSAESGLEPELTISPQGGHLSVTADKPEHAKAGLAALATTMQAALHTPEADLNVSQDNSTVPVPNELSKRVSFGMRVAVVLLMLAGQLLMVIGGHARGATSTGLFVSIAAPFVLMLTAAGSPGGPTGRGFGTALFEYTDFTFLAVLLAVTPVAVIVSLWLTRGENRRRTRR